MVAEYFLWFLTVTGLIYAALILVYTYGWFSLKTHKTQKVEADTPKASIIIPARNESENILNLLRDLIRLNTDKKLYEVIVVDDHSEDNTPELVDTFIADNRLSNMRLIRVSGNLSTGMYKKGAISLGLKEADGELIITTDADCRVGPEWLNALLGFHQEEKPKMIVGPVMYEDIPSPFTRMQGLEFLSLIAITGGAIKIGRPVMCNGANLMYEKSAFDAVGGFSKDGFASGDDVFLLLRFYKAFGPESVRFLKNTDAVVKTKPVETIGQFIQQRTRWASKNKGYDLRILFVSVTVYLLNLLIVAGLLLAAFGWLPWKTYLLALALKSLIDLPILIGITSFVKQQKLLPYSLLLIPLYPLYIVITGALGITGGFRWKGRKINR
ncbi:MAG: glycosyltransferase [Bacteroidales bacterium]